MRDFFTKNLGFYLIPTKKTRKKCIFNKKNRNLEQKHPKKSLMQGCIRRLLVRLVNLAGAPRNKKGGHPPWISASKL